MATSEALLDSVANENTKVGAGGPAFWMNGVMSAYGQATQAVLNANSRAIENFNTTMGMLNKALVEEDPTDAVSKQKILSGNDLVQQLGQLGSLIAQLQQTMKGAQSTPPETAAGK